MNETKQLKMICRLCLEVSQNNLEIYDETGDNQIAETIAKYFHIEIHPDDLVSTTVCEECWQHLSDFHRFLLRIEEKQSTLRKQLICEDIKQDSAGVGGKEVVIVTNTNASFDHKSIELLEPEIELVEEQAITFAEGFDFDGVNIKNSGISMDNDSFLVPLITAVDGHALEENVIELDTTKKRKHKKSKPKIANTATKKRLREYFRSKTKTVCSDSPLFTCKLCSQEFDKQYILNDHLKTTHPTEKAYICPTCDKGFKSAAILKQHEKTIHLNVYESVCDFCGKCFKTVHSLASHMEGIHNEKPRSQEQCKICLRWLKNPRYLKKHMKLHSDQETGQEFKCPQCGIEKDTRYALTAHIRYHHSDKVFKCKVCSKVFKHPRGLREHESKHTGTYLYSCPFCPKVLRSHSNMHKHKVTQHFQEWEKSRSQPGHVTESSGHLPKQEKHA